MNAQDYMIELRRAEARGELFVRGSSDPYNKIPLAEYGKILVRSAAKLCLEADKPPFCTVSGADGTCSYADIISLNPTELDDLIEKLGMIK